MAGGTTADQAVLVALGVVHTGLLQHSTALSAAACQRILALLPGERVHTFERPISYAVSPELLTGVDCQLAGAAGAAPRAVGSVATRAAITGGHVLQGSAVAQVFAGAAGRRLPWAHYLARPGRVEATGRFDAEALARGHLAAPRTSSTLDLSALAARPMDGIQGGPELDRQPPLRTARVQLRWAAVVTADPAPASLGFTVEPGHRRTVLLTCRAEQVSAVAEFCADLALHDWLLSTLLGLIQRSRIGARPRPEVIAWLRPAVDHLLHLWMPAARTDPVTAQLWESLERRPGLGRQWGSTVDRIRDQMALSTIALLTGARRETVG